MAGVLVIGIGNTLRWDDGVGWAAAERLMKVLPQDRARVEVCHQLNPEMAEEVAQVGLVVFIDAAATGAKAGEVECKEVRPREEKWGAFVHHLEPASLLGCARDLYGACPAAKVVSVVGGDFGLGEELSPEVKEAVEKVVGVVTQMVEEYWRGVE